MEVFIPEWNYKFQVIYKKVSLTFVFFFSQITCQSVNSSNLLNSDNFQNLLFCFSWIPFIDTTVKVRKGEIRGGGGLLHYFKISEFKYVTYINTNPEFPKWL